MRYQVVIAPAAERDLRNCRVKRGVNFLIFTCLEYLMPHAKWEPPYFFLLFLLIKLFFLKEKFGYMANL